MTLYELVKIANDTLTPNSTLLYDYILNSSDNNGGFLRTSYCKKSKPLKDIDIIKTHIILIAFEEPFDSALLDFTQEGFTRTNLQFFYVIRGQEDLQAEKRWSEDLGYPHFITIDF